MFSKKVFAYFLIFTMLFVVTGCGAKKSLKITPEKFYVQYNATLEEFSNSQKINLNHMKINKYDPIDGKEGFFYTPSGVKIGWGKDNAKDSDVRCLILKCSKLSQDAIYAMGIMVKAASEKTGTTKGLELLQKGKISMGVRDVKDAGVVFGLAVSEDVVLYSIADEEFHNKHLE